MEYRKAELNDLGSVFSIAQAVIRDIYPYFYPAAAVQWFAAQHDCESILADITAGRVRLFEVHGTPVGTVTIDGNRLLRVFVAPDQQRKGYGDRMLRFAEDEVAQAHDKVVLDSSLPSGRFFQTHGYRTRSHEVYDIEDGRGMLTAILAWEVMEKLLREAETPADKEPTPEAAAPTADAAPSPETPAPEESTQEPEAPAAPSIAPEAAASSEGGATITISSDTANVMRQLPQMPF